MFLDVITTMFSQVGGAPNERQVVHFAALLCNVCKVFCNHAQCRLAAAIKLNRLQEARAAAAALNTSDGWRQLGTAAMQLLDVELALAASRQVGPLLSASVSMYIASLGQCSACFYSIGAFRLLALHSG
jgi:hypothetical protein